MASIRIEDEARKDPRFVLLGRKMGTTRFDALSRMAELWAYCTENQTYYMREEIIDVCAEFDGFAKLIVSLEIGLAETSDKGIRIKGTRGRIEWLKKLRDNGKKGGRPKKTRTKPEGNQMETRSEPPSNPLTPVLIPTLVPVPALTKKQERTKSSATANAAVGTATWEAYRQAYAQRYKTDPVRNAVVNSQIAQLVKRLGQEAADVAAFYVRHNSEFYVRKLHPIGLCLSDAEKLRTEWATGKLMLGGQAREIERIQQNQNTFAAAAIVVKGDRGNG